LFLELCRPSPYRGRDALGGDHFTELSSEFRLCRVKRADNVEPGVNRGAETCGQSLSGKSGKRENALVPPMRPSLAASAGDRCTGSR
jgi:hypothetical protein